MLKDNDTSVAVAASQYLLRHGGTDVPVAAQTIVERGLSNSEHNQESRRVVDELLSQPVTAPVAREALNRALWSSDQDTAWFTAVYLLTRGDRMNPGVPRGVAYGGYLSGRSREAETWIRLLLADTSTRSATIDALGALLYSEHEPGLHSARLLIESGASIHKGVLAALAKLARWQPWVPLATLSLAERVDEVRDAATGDVRLKDLYDLLTSEATPASQ